MIQRSASWLIWLGLWSSLPLALLGQGITDNFQSKAAVRDIQLFDPAHYDIYDLYGSRGGGTRVRLIGNDLLNPDGSFDTSIMVTVGGEHATLIPFLSTDKQLVIDTPPKAPGRQDCCHSFRVFNQHGEIPNVTQDLRKFRYSSEHTPYIYGIVPSAAAPGDVVQVHGSYRWSRLYMQHSSDDPRLLVRSVEIGPVRCILPWSDDPEDTELGSYYSSLPCHVPTTTTPGYYNASVTISDTFGKALPYKPHFELASPGSSNAMDSVPTFWPVLHDNGNINMMQVLPAIDFVDMEGGSMAGGQVIHVQGRGFGKMKDSITIDVGGVPCKVVEAQESEVACVLATGNRTTQDTYRGGAGVRITYYEDVNGYGDSAVKSVVTAPTMNLPLTYDKYRVHMDTVFTAPFTGMGYFVANCDDYVQMRMIKLGSSGQAISSEELLLNSPYTRRSWSTYNGQKSRNIRLIKGEQYSLTLDHANYGGPGYLDVALVHRDAPPSWSSEKGEEQTLFLRSNFMGQQQQLDLGQVMNGSFYLQIDYINNEGYRVESRTNRIDFEANHQGTMMQQRIDDVMKDAGVSVSTHKNVTENGDVVLTFTFRRPSVDGLGYKLTLRGFNATCSTTCTAGSGDVADVIRKEGPYDWGAQVVLDWNGWASQTQIPAHLIDSDRTNVETELLSLLQGIGVPIPRDQDSRQDNGALRAHVAGNVFDGVEVVFTWPAAMGPVTHPYHVNATSSGSAAGLQRILVDNGLNVTVLSQGAGFTVRTERTEAITDAWYHPIEASVFSVPEQQPQVVLHSHGVRAMCLAEDGCHVRRSIDDTPILTHVEVTGKAVMIAGSGFGNEVVLDGFLPPVEIGSVECMFGGNGTWNDTELRCELQSPPLPGYSAVKVHVPSKGFAAAQSVMLDTIYTIYTPLQQNITTRSKGGDGGGWPVVFNSPSQQLGSEPSKLYVRFTTVPEYSQTAVEVYLLPDADGDEESMSVLVCTRVELEEDAPVPEFFGLTPRPLHIIDDDSDYSPENNDMHVSEGNALQPGSAQDPPQVHASRIAEEYGISDLPDACIYFSAPTLSWSLTPARFSVPAPPREIFDTLLHYEVNRFENGSPSDEPWNTHANNQSDHGNASANAASNSTDTAMRRLLDIGIAPASEVSPVVAELYANAMFVAQADVVYNEDEGPRVSNVIPEVISAVVPEIVTVNGSGFGNVAENVRVWIGDKECYVRSASDTTIKCRARGGGTFGRLPVTVLANGQYASGRANVTGVFYVSSISQLYGSAAGGSILEIHGDGFADHGAAITTNFVSIGVFPAAPCRVLSSSRTMITCQTEPAGRMHAGATEGLLNPVEVSVSGIYAQCQAPPVCTPGCDPSLSQLGPGSAYGGSGGSYGGPGSGGSYGATYGGQGAYGIAEAPVSLGSYGRPGNYGGAYGGQASVTTQRCCPFTVPDPASLEPIPFIGNDQGFGADNCAFYYTSHATPRVTSVSHNVNASGLLHMQGSKLNGNDINIYLARVEESGVQRWTNPYRVDSDPPEAVKLPDLWSPDGVDHLMLQVHVQSSTDVVARVPADIEPGTYLPLVWSEDTGAAEFMLHTNGSAALPLVNVQPHIEQVQPASLTNSGGMITITGAGFPSDLQRVRLEGKGGRWVVLEASHTMITAYTPGWLYADGPPLAVSVMGVEGEMPECEFDQQKCKLYAAAAEWSQFIQQELYIDNFDQEASGAAVTIFIRNETANATTSLGSRNVQVMLGRDILPAVVDTSAATVTLTQDTILQLPASAPSGHEIVILIDGMAAAGKQPVIHVPLAISTMSSSVGSLAGGQSLVISGTGFSEIPGETEVSLCDQPCDIAAGASSNMIECTTHRYWKDSAPVSDHVNLPVRPDQVLGSGTAGEQKDNPASRMFDGQVESEWRSSNGETCEFTVDWSPHVAQISLVRILIPADVAARGSMWEPESQISGLVVDVSNDALNWDRVVHGESAAPYATGWTELNIDSTEKHRYVRVQITNRGNSCIVPELQFIGVTRPTMEPDDCAISITVFSQSGIASINRTSMYSYDSTVTPEVSSVSPSYGTAAGGTSVMILGKNLPESTKDALVKIDGVPCTVNTTSSTALTCVTGARLSIPDTTSFSVSSLSYGMAELGSNTFAYKDLWSSRITWAGEPAPVDGESVIIPAGQTILYDLAGPQSPRLRLLLVEGKLEFLDDHDLELHAEWIMVRGAGSAFTVGRETAPFMHSAKITLHGRRSTAREIPSYGAKNIAVRYGTLDLHGRPKTPTWTRLGITAEAGTSTVQLAEPVNWQIGDEIAIASSAWDPSEVEQRRIVSVSKNGLILTLDKPLSHEHWGDLVDMANRTVDMRAEVGCLSRNVVIQGDEESDVDQYGAHIMLASPPRGRLATTIGRISQIECFRCGQAFMLGRYPLHFHMMGEVHDSYIRGAAVHRTFNRAVTIHGVHYLRIEDVVAYDNMGHTFFIEDAIESQNRIVHNLALWTRKSMSLLDTDTTPASFWVTFPTNYFYNNSAAGSERYGFWFDLQAHPTGPSHTTSICPPGEPLGAFTDNTAHSNVRYGFRVFNQWVPLDSGLSPCQWSQSGAQQHPRTATLLRYTGYKNGRTGLMLSRAGDVRCVGCALVDNMRAGAELNRMDAPYGTTGTYDTIIGINSPAMAKKPFPHSVRDDPDSPRTYGWIVSGFTNEQVVTDTTFVGFTGPEAYAVSTCDHCNFPNSKNQGAKTTHFANISFVDTDSIIFYGAGLNAILHDMDGSLSGYDAGTYISHNGWPHLLPSCPVGKRLGWSTSAVCPTTKRLIRLMVDLPSPYWVYQQREMVVQYAEKLENATLLPQDMAGTGMSRSMIPWGDRKKKDNPNGWAVVVASDEHYHLWWNSPNVIPERYRFGVTDMLNTSRANAPLPEAVFVTMPYLDVWGYIDISGAGDTRIPNDLSLPDVQFNSTGDSYRSFDNNTLSMLLSGRENPGTGWWWNQQVTVRAQSCPPQGCPAPVEVSVERDSTVRSWSDPKIWQSLPEEMRPMLDPATGQPAAGASVSIPPEWVVELDTDSAALEHLELDGLLTFAEGADITLTTETIKMSTGAMVAGNETHPHDGKVTIRVSSPNTGKEAKVPANARRLYVGGSNVLEVLGDINLYGASSLPQTTHLAVPAAPGDTAITVTDAAQWQPGEEIFLTSTGHSWEEAEYAIIVACNGTTVTLAEPLRFGHFGAADMFRDAAISAKTKFEGMETRAQVLLLTRSITIEGGGERDGHGAKMFVSELEVQRQERGLTLTTIYRGKLNIANVAFRGMGQVGTGRAALTIESTSNGTTIQNSTFSHGFGPGIEVRMAELVQITDSVVVDTEGPAISVWNDETASNGKKIPDHPKAVILRNTAGFARKLGVTARLDTVSGFVLCPYSSSCTIHSEDNIAAGSENYGFIFGMAKKCGIDDSAMGANTAHSCRVGFVYLSEASYDCSRVSNAIAHHTTEVGVVYDRGGLSMEVEHLLLSDNRIGLAIMPKASRSIDSGSVKMSHMAAIGYSNNGGCGFDSSITCPDTCTERDGLPNYSEDGDAECGPRIGITTSVWFNGAKPWPRKPPLMGPWSSVDGDAALGGYTDMSDIALVNWPDVDACGCRHFSITPNPTSDDLTPTAFVRRMSMSNVSSNAKYYPPPADPGRATFDNCGDFECTGLTHAVLVDTDGSLVGEPASVTGNNSNLTMGDSRRYHDKGMGAWVIPGGNYRELYFESLDPDRMSRRVQPVSVSGLGAAGGRSSIARLNCFEDHLWDFDYTSLLRLSRFATTVELSGEYTIMYAGTPPQQHQISMSGIAAEEGVLLRFKYSVAQTFKIQVKGEAMQLPSARPVTLADPAGANHWAMDTFELTVVVKGPHPIMAKQLPMVRISMAIQMDLQTFLDTPPATFTSGLAFALGLDPSTIRITGYKSLGARRRLADEVSVLELTYSIIPLEYLQEDSPPPPPPMPSPPYPPGYVAPPTDAPGTSQPVDTSPVARPSNGGEAFDPVSLLALADTIKRATASVDEIIIAGVPVSTSSLVTEVQEAVPPQCTPTCKTADNGVQPSCIDGQCTCDAAFVYYDAIAEAEATKPSGCYEDVSPTIPGPDTTPGEDPEVSPSPSPLMPNGTSPPPTSPPGTVSRPAITVEVRFPDMFLNQTTDEFEAALCDVPKARIRTVLDSGKSGDPTPLFCDVSTRSGSVIADITILLPASVEAAAIVDAVSDLSTNLEQDISDSPVLAAFLPIDPPQVASGMVDRTPVDVTPVVSDMPTLVAPSGPLAAQAGPTVTLEAVFVLYAPDGDTVDRSRVAVTGFTADDVITTSEHDNGTVLPMNVTVQAMPNDWYRLTIGQDLDGWPLESRDSCDTWTLTVTVPAGAALTNDTGDSTGASTATVVPWRPGGVEICGEIDADKGNGLALGLGLAGALLLSAIVAVAIMVVRSRRRQVRYLNEAMNDVHDQNTV